MMSRRPPRRASPTTGNGEVDVGLMTEPGPGGRFGEFGGRYVPESLVPACAELEAAFREAWADTDDGVQATQAGYRAELAGLLRDYAGRPTPVTECARL